MILPHFVALRSMIFSVPRVSPWCAVLWFFGTRQIAYMQNKLITAGQLVVGVIRADVVRGVDSDAGTRPGQPTTPYPGAGGRLAACLNAALPSVAGQSPYTRRPRYESTAAQVMLTVRGRTESLKNLRKPCQIIMRICKGADDDHINLKNDFGYLHDG